MSTPARAARRLAAPSAARKTPAVGARAVVIRGRATCDDKRTRLTFQQSFHSHRGFNSGATTPAARPQRWIVLSEHDAKIMAAKPRRITSRPEGAIHL